MNTQIICIILQFCQWLLGYSLFVINVAKKLDMSGVNKSWKTKVLHVTHTIDMFLHQDIPE